VGYKGKEKSKAAEVIRLNKKAEGAVAGQSTKKDRKD
jgi:hypothetical protein